MCPVKECTCCSTSSSTSAWSTVGTLIVAFVVGLVWLIRRVVVPLVRHVVAPAAAIAAVIVGRWLSGASMSGRARSATFTRGSVPPALPPRRFVPRLHWAHWPGYQRAIVRWAITALVVAGLLYPVATVLAVVSVIAATLAVRYREAIRRAFRPDVIRVRATVAQQAAPALTAHAEAPIWSAVDEQAAAR